MKLFGMLSDEGKRGRENRTKRREERDKIG